jgi:hypothetical protein
MWGDWTIAAVVAATGLGVACGFASYRKRHLHCARLRLAKDRLHRRREWLEAEFLSLASARGKSRSLVWADCEFDNAVAIARDRHSGQLRALVGITVTFAPSDDGGLEDRDAELSQRAATAVFHFDGAQWTTDGRAVFNLNPAETIRRYHHELELVE